MRSAEHQQKHKRTRSAHARDTSTKRKKCNDADDAEVLDGHIGEGRKEEH